MSESQSDGPDLIEQIFGSDDATTEEMTEQETTDKSLSKEGAKGPDSKLIEQIFGPQDSTGQTEDGKQEAGTREDPELATKQQKAEADFENSDPRAAVITN